MFFIRIFLIKIFDITTAANSSRTFKLSTFINQTENPRKKLQLNTYTLYYICYPPFTFNPIIIFFAHTLKI